MNDTVTVTLTREQYLWVIRIARHEWEKYQDIIDEHGEKAVRHCRNTAHVAESVTHIQPNP